MGKKSTSSSTTDKDKETVLWDGKNFSFAKFDRNMTNWACTKWNDELGVQLWRDLFADELFDIPESATEWLDHCEMVHRFNLTDDYKSSKALYADADFWTHAHQKIWLDRQRGLMFRKVEKCVEGGAETVLNSTGVKEARKLRKALMKKYGNARAVKLETRQKLFDLGMPPTDDKNCPMGQAFEERTDMGEKFQELEDEMDEFRNTCPEKHRATYKYGMDTHLTRVVKNNIHSSYHEVVRSVESMHRIREAGGLKVQGVDLHEHSYTDEHLPPWEELKDAVIEQYEVRRLNWDSNSVEQRSTKVPIMMVGNDPKCFACGETGHRRGASSCRAATGTVHESAPDWVKNQKKGGNGGKGKGNPKSGEQICNYFKQHGTCRYGDRCKFKHVGGGSSSGSGSSGGNYYSMNKGDRKRMTTMVAQSLCDQFQQGAKKGKKEGGDGKDAVDRLFSLISGAGKE